MTDIATRILQSLAAVDAERRRRAAEPALAAGVVAVKRYQQARFERMHADLFESTRYAPAARFFVDELYGPQDFAQRDAQFSRIVPALVRLFPDDIVETVEALAAVHALSERLDSALSGHLGGAAPARESYVRAWQATGEPESRRRQLELVVRVGRSLDRHTRSRMLRASLKAMRGPARAAGLGTLQAFLETGFDAFGAMRGAREFLAMIETRETALVERLFQPDAVAAATGDVAPDDLLAQLP
ncbi:MAG: FFLEELY motif protein [Burkholderiaceae bacterium]